MCIIIVKKKGDSVSEEVLRNSAEINQDGLGVVWLDNYSVNYYRSDEWKVLDVARPYIAHFRYATIGVVSRENTHPFVCGANKNELLMMNGTIKNLGNKDVSDSRALASILGDMPRHKWKDELSKHKSRFVTINRLTKTYQIYNKELWTQRGGVWYSKANVFKDNTIAVYGTLKKGYNNYFNYLSDAKFVGSGSTLDKYPLVINGLPYLIDKKGIGHNVEVDVFKVDDNELAQLDRLEGHPTWYQRRQIDIKVKDKVKRCWVYFNLRPIEANEKYHRSYKQEERKPKKWSFSRASKDVNLWSDYSVGEQEFEFTHNSKMCIECYNDLEYDGFGSYHCCGCNGWFSESEVLVNY